MERPSSPGTFQVSMDSMGLSLNGVIHKPRGQDEVGGW